MAKLTFASLGATRRAYAGFISEFRTRMQEAYSYYKKDPKAQVALINTVQPLAVKLNAPMVVNGQTVPATGAGTTATLVVSNGVLTGVTLA